MALNITVTDAGRAALVNAANNGTNPVVIAQAGITATAVVPSASATVIPGEIKRISTISGDVVADDMIHLVVRDETADSYALRSFGLYLADGTLFAIYGQATPVVEKSAQAMMLLAIDIAFADIDAAAITFGDANFINPPATEEALGVVELATPEETATGVDTKRAVHPKGLKDAVTSWLNARFGEGNPSTFMKGLLATASAAALRVALGLKSAALKDEGAGNGLDADLLDGQQGSWYVDVPARLGFTPWGPNNDGAGSGLDADLLDGLQGSAYAKLSGATFTGPLRVQFAGSPALVVNSTGGANTRLVAQADGTVALYRGNSESEVIAFSMASNSGPFAVNMPMTRQGYTVWDSGNDGAGSGLDADLLDGYHAAAFLRLESNTRLQQDRGYLLYANGIKETWGEIVLNANSAGYWDYPVAFSTWVHPQISVTVVNGEDNASQVTGITSVGLTGIYLYTASNSAVRVYVRIIGV